MWRMTKWAETQTDNMWGWVGRCGEVEADGRARGRKIIRHTVCTPTPAGAPPIWRNCGEVHKDLSDAPDRSEVHRGNVRSLVSLGYEIE